MDTLARIEAERACERLVARYALAVNDWDIDRFVALFVPEAVWQRPGVPAYNGHAEIRAFMESSPTERTLRHVNGLCVVTVDGDGESATAISQTTVYEAPERGALPVRLTQPNMVVEYRDVIVRRNGEWLFIRRETTQVFAARS